MYTRPFYTNKQTYIHTYECILTMESPKIKHSILEKHELNLDDKQKTYVTFYSYYSNATPIYYELDPIIKIFKFTKEPEIIATIPKYWMKRVVDFNDTVFGSRHIQSSALFIEASGIAFLIAICENKSLATTVTNLYNMCIRKAENDRVKRINTKVVDLKSEVVVLKSQLESVTSNFNDMKRVHASQIEILTHKQASIKEALDIITNSHSSIQATLKALSEKI